MNLSIGCRHQTICKWSRRSTTSSKFSCYRSSVNLFAIQRVLCSRYVAVTNRCCTTSLIESRGPGLSMPSSFHPLPGGTQGAEPSVENVLGEIKRELGGAEVNFDELVFAGVGEPLLRWPVVREVVHSLKSRHPSLLHLKDASQTTNASSSTTENHADNEHVAELMPIRLVTSGLSAGGVTSTQAASATVRALAKQISEAFDSVSVALNSADSAQYVQLMKPSVEGLKPQDAHAAVCDLVRECAAQGLATECTVVAREDVDVARVEELAARLGASCRVRPYFSSPK